MVQQRLSFPFKALKGDSISVMNKLMLTEDKKAEHNMLLENAIVLDCGKNTATLYDPKTDTCKIIIHEDILKLAE